MRKLKFQSWISTFLWALLGAVCIALAAQVSISKFGQFELRVPITLQSLAVLMAAFLLRRPGAVWMIVIYLFAGAAGLPVFSDGASGVEVLKGNTGGYLFGFISGAFLVALLAERGWGRSLDRILGAMTIGTVVILFFGVFRLYIGHGLDRALTWGFFPILPGAGIKIVVGALLVWVANRIRSDQEILPS